jgi:hypothetical protein
MIHPKEEDCRIIGRILGGFWEDFENAKGLFFNPASKTESGMKYMGDAGKL